MVLGMVTSWHHPNFAKSSKADGLLHMDLKGKIHIYSGVGHVGYHGTDNVLNIVSEVFKCNIDDLIVHLGNNPSQLPALLSQHSNHMSFSSAKTIKKAALILKEKSSKGIELRETHLENGISKETRIMAMGIKLPGITIAVKEVT